MGFGCPWTKVWCFEQALVSSTVLYSKPWDPAISMNGAQVVGLVQARLQRRQAPQGPWAVLPLSHCTRVLECWKNKAKKSRLPKWSARLRVGSWSREILPFSNRINVETFSCAYFCCLLVILIVVIVAACMNGNCFGHSTSELKPWINT